jgi:hypothetical protein
MLRTSRIPLSSVRQTELSRVVNVELFEQFVAGFETCCVASLVAFSLDTYLHRDHMVTLRLLLPNPQTSRMCFQNFSCARKRESMQNEALRKKSKDWYLKLQM